ncbi:MAG: hypothetical protein R2810_00715 [Flavobacteriales bacterium]
MTVRTGRKAKVVEEARGARPGAVRYKRQSKSFEEATDQVAEAPGARC